MGLNRYVRYKRIPPGYASHIEEWFTEKEFGDLVRKEFDGKAKIFKVIKKEVVENG